MERTIQKPKKLKSLHREIIVQLSYENKCHEEKHKYLHIIKNFLTHIEPSSYASRSMNSL